MLGYKLISEIEFEQCREILRGGSNPDNSLHKDYAALSRAVSFLIARHPDLQQEFFRQINFERSKLK